MSTLMSALGVWLILLGAAFVAYVLVRMRWKKAGPRRSPDRLRKEKALWQTGERG